MATEIKLTPFEIQSGLTRQMFAEMLIEQLPADHEGRNTWLLNYGCRDEAESFRRERGIDMKLEYCAAEWTSTDDS